MVLAVFIFSILCAPLQAQSAEETPYSRAVQSYDNGDFRSAFIAFRELAQMGHGGAEFMLGVMHFYGRGVERNSGIAAIWFYKSARQGNPAAQLAFGSMFIRGVGVSPDIIEAYKWLTLAKGSGVQDITSQAEALIKQAESRMTRDDIAKAQSLADSFDPVTTGPLGME